MGGRGSKPMSEKQLNEHRQVTVLQNEVEAMGDMFTRMNRQCYEKCLSKPIFEGKGDSLFPMFDGKGDSTGDPELTLDDNNCVSNCAAKFSHAQSLVGNYYMEQAKEAEKAGTPAPGQPGYVG